LSLLESACGNGAAAPAQIVSGCQRVTQSIGIEQQGLVGPFLDVPGYGGIVFRAYPTFKPTQSANNLSTIHALFANCRWIQKISCSFPVLQSRSRIHLHAR
ncbi:hypothetical protein BDZ89DRAFT_1066497, partial [Hymenopellis radicata]